jgi:hypothetical protein
MDKRLPPTHHEGCAMNRPGQFCKKWIRTAAKLNVSLQASSMNMTWEKIKSGIMMGLPCHQLVAPNPNLFLNHHQLW